MLLEDPEGAVARSGLRLSAEELAQMRRALEGLRAGEGEALELQQRLGW